MQGSHRSSRVPVRKLGVHLGGGAAVCSDREDRFLLGAFEEKEGRALIPRQKTLSENIIGTEEEGG